MHTTTYPHIDISPEGIPVLADTQTKVMQIVLDRLAYHWDVDEIQRQHHHLTLGQICSALAYYYDHQDEMDRAIEEQLRRVREIKTRLGESPVRQKLKALGLLA